MSERMTGIKLPGLPMGTGFQDYGLKSVGEMIKTIQDKARYDIENAKKILDAKDEDFLVETYVGPYARKKLEVIQSGKKP